MKFNPPQLRTRRAMNVTRNSVVRSRNHCCHRHAITRASVLLTNTSVNNKIMKALPWKHSNSFYLLLRYIRRCQHYETHLSMHVKCKIFLSETYFKVANTKFHRNPSGGSRSDTCRQKGGHDKCAFCLYVSAPKNGSSNKFGA